MCIRDSNETLELRDGGTLASVEGSFIRARTLVSGSDAEFDIGGRIDIDRFDGDFVQNGGNLVFNENLGITVFEDDYLLTQDGTINFEIGGLLRGVDFGAIDVMGLALINGVLDIDLLDDFDPTQGDSFQLFGASVTGDYSFNFADAQLSEGLVFDTSNFDLDGTISIVSVPEPRTAVLFLFVTAFVATRRRNRCCL